MTEPTPDLQVPEPTPAEPFPSPLPPSGPGLGDALSAAERDLLAAVHCWARTHGWTAHDWMGWVNAADSAHATAGVRIERVGGCGISVFTRPSPEHPWPVRAIFRPVRSVGEGVDALVELGILPPFPWDTGEHTPRYWPTAAAYAALGA